MFGWLTKKLDKISDEVIVEFEDELNNKSREVESNELDLHQSHESELVQVIIAKLKSNPDNFTAISHSSLQNYVYSIKGKRIDIYKDGEILSPIRNPYCTKKQREELTNLVKEIIKRDSLKIIESYITGINNENCSKS